MPNKNMTKEERNKEATEVMVADPNSVVLEREGKTCMAHRDQMAILEKAGWKKSVPKKAEDFEPPQKPKINKDTPLEVIKKYLEEKEISYHPNTGEAKLREMYTKHKASNPAEQ